MKFTVILLFAVLFVEISYGKVEQKKIASENFKKEMLELIKGKREAGPTPYYYGGPPRFQSFHLPGSNSLDVGSGYSFGGPKAVGHSSSSDSSALFGGSSYPLFQPHSASVAGPSFSTSPHFSIQGGHSATSHSPRYTSINGLYKTGNMGGLGGKFSGSSLGNKGPQIFGPGHLGGKTISSGFSSKPSAVFGFSSPVQSLSSHTSSKGLGAFASSGGLHTSISNLLSQSGSHNSPVTYMAPASSYGTPIFGGSHGGSISGSFSDHGAFSGNSISSPNPFAGFFNTHDKPIGGSFGGSFGSNIGSSYKGGSSSFKPSVFLGSSVPSPSHSYGSPSFSSHSISPSSSYGIPAQSGHGSPLASSYDVPSYSGHGASPASSYSIPSISAHSAGIPSISSHSAGISSLSGQMSSLPFSLSESDRAKLLSGKPIYITGNQLAGHSSGIESLGSGSYGSPSLSGSHEIPSAGHAAPALSFSHLLGGQAASSSSYGLPSFGHGASSLGGHESISSSYEPQSAKQYLTHESPSESVGSHSSGNEGYASNFGSSIAHGSSSPSLSYASPSHLSGSSFGGSSGLSFEGIGSGKLELPSLGGHAFSGAGSSSPLSYNSFNSNYDAPSNSYGAPHDTYGLPKSYSTEDSHGASSESKYDTIKYSQTLSADDKSKH